MKTKIKNLIVLIALFLGVAMFAQERNLDNYRSPDKNGINVFEF